MPHWQLGLLAAGCVGLGGAKNATLKYLTRCLSFSHPSLTLPCACAQVRSRLPAGVDGWAYSLKGMMGMVVVGGLLIAATYYGLQRTVVPKVQARQPKKKKSKPNMGVGESFRFLAKSPYIRDLALLVSLAPP